MKFWEKYIGSARIWHWWRVKSQIKEKSMAIQEIKNAQGHVIGRIKTNPNDIMEIFNERGNLRGTYNTRTNETRDHQGHLVGKGNLLTTLL
jgi:hypothetical protein